MSNGWPTLGKRKRMSAQDLSRENRSKLKEGRDVYKKEERPINHSRVLERNLRMSKVLTG